MNYTIEVGDLVHARFYNEDRSRVMIQDFRVSIIDGTIYSGGAQDCDASAGWEIELVAKSFDNLNLPSEISEITAYDKYNKKHFLVGKQNSWRTEKGLPFNTVEIFRWEGGHI